MNDFELTVPDLYYGKTRIQGVKTHSHGTTATATKLSCVNSLIDIHAAHSEMRSFVFFPFYTLNETILDNTKIPVFEPTTYFLES